jgi:hypothetical protein
LTFGSTAYIIYGEAKMTAWDVLDTVINSFPPVVMALILVAVLVALVILIVGFSRHGLNFLKYGFKQTQINELGEKIDGLRDEFKTELEAIKVNHFGHLKNFLGELTGILLDKGLINNQDKARLDNQLRGM